MKKKICAVLLGMAFLFAGPLSAYAGGPDVSFGFRIGVGHPRAWHGHPGWWGPRVHWRGPIVVAPFPYYVPPRPPVIVHSAPPVYVQPRQPEEDYWYYCQNPQGYYPYVGSCPGGWMKVVPQATPPDVSPSP